MKPSLSWVPLRLFPALIDEKTLTLEDWFRQAREQFGLDYVEIHHATLNPYDPQALEAVKKALEKFHLRVSQITCAPDFTHPDPAERERQLDDMKVKVNAAQFLGAEGVRVTAGCEYPGVSRSQAINWAVEALLRLADYAQPRKVKLGFENHYKDKRWTNVDWAFHTDRFLEIFDRVKDSWVGVNFDCSNQLMTGDDPMTVLEVVKHKVWHVHASDRRRGEYLHTVVGEGEVNFDPIFATLASVGYSGCISLEDGNPIGDEGTRRGLEFLRRKIDEHWKSDP